MSSHKHKKGDKVTLKSLEEIFNDVNGKRNILGFIMIDTGLSMNFYMEDICGQTVIIDEISKSNIPGSKWYRIEGYVWSENCIKEKKPLFDLTLLKITI